MAQLRAPGHPRVGVLALQGDVREHVRVLEQLGAVVSRVRRPEELAEVDGLVIPGGESSVIDKLCRTFNLSEPLRERIKAGMPVYGTCAGLIMLSDRVLDAIKGQSSLGGLDVTVRRNAFGSQLDSFETDIAMPALTHNRTAHPRGDNADQRKLLEAPVHAVFIRAPVVEEVGPAATILGALDDGRVVAVEQGALLGTSFHPEVVGETRFHERFLAKVRALG